MRNLLKHISIFFWVCIGLALGACSSDSTSDSSLLAKGVAGYDVTLNLHVSIDNVPSSGKTRDGEEEQTGFEDDPEPYELIHTLRVIIVRPDNTVEYNRPIILDEDVSVKELANREDLKFRVSTSQGNFINDEKVCVEQKRIYLIANEASFESSGSEETANIIKELRNLKPSFYDKVDEDEPTSVSNKGDKLDPTKVSKWLVYNDWKMPDAENPEVYAKPFIDNESSNTGKEKYVPMTEFFDIEVKANVNQTNNELTQQDVNLFITRNFVKFQFYVEGNTETFKVSRINFHSLMQKEYFFPNMTIYSPAKYPISNENGVIPNREIIDFNTPGKAGNLVRNYIFEPQKLGFKPDEPESADYPRSYKPSIYFCETQNFIGDIDNKSIFKIGIDVDFYNEDGSIQKAYFEPDDDHILKNLPYGLPRNTIVKVNFKIGNRELIETVVTLVPYISIELTPGFGLENLCPGDHEQPASW